MKQFSLKSREISPAGPKILEAWESKEASLAFIMIRGWTWVKVSWNWLVFDGLNSLLFPKKVAPSLGQLWHRREKRSARFWKLSAVKCKKWNQNIKMPRIHCFRALQLWIISSPMNYLSTDQNITKCRFSFCCSRILA